MLTEKLNLYRVKSTCFNKKVLHMAPRLRQFYNLSIVRTKELQK